MPAINALLFLAIALCSCGGAAAWQPTTSLPTRRTTLAAATPIMMAKAKKQQPKKRVKKKKVDPRPALSGPPPPTASPTPSLMADAAPRPAPGSSIDPSAPMDDRLDSVLQRAGISQRADNFAAGGPGPSRAASADPLSRIPKAGQEALERFFAGGALVFGTAFILSGLAVAVEAIAKVAGAPLPVVLDEALVQYVEPALTPSILILFFFSISLGVLKQVTRVAPASRVARHLHHLEKYYMHARLVCVTCAARTLCYNAPRNSLADGRKPRLGLTRRPLTAVATCYACASCARSSSSAPSLPASCTRRATTTTAPRHRLQWGGYCE